MHTWCLFRGQVWLHNSLTPSPNSARVWKTFAACVVHYMGKGSQQYAAIPVQENLKSLKFHSLLHFPYAKHVLDISGTFPFTYTIQSRIHCQNPIDNTSVTDVAIQIFCIIHFNSFCWGPELQGYFTLKLTQNFSFISHTLVRVSKINLKINVPFPLQSSSFYFQFHLFQSWCLEKVSIQFLLKRYKLPMIFPPPLHLKYSNTMFTMNLD